MSMLEWAKQEIEIACRKGSESGYGFACYKSALKAFESLVEDGHSGASIGFTKGILNRLIEGKCLTPIEDTEDIWRYAFTRHDGVKVYQCARMFSLFKDVYPDGSSKYTDNDRVVKVHIGTNTLWHSKLTDDIVNELYPITMPYLPSEKPYLVFCKNFLSDAKNGDFDTVGVLYGTDPFGNRFGINRYFKDGEDEMIEIDRAEYENRKQMDKKRQGDSE